MAPAVQRLSRCSKARHHFALKCAPPRCVYLLIQIMWCWCVIRQPQSQQWATLTGCRKEYQAGFNWEITTSPMPFPDKPLHVKWILYLLYLHYLILIFNISTEKRSFAESRGCGEGKVYCSIRYCCVWWHCWREEDIVGQEMLIVWMPPFSGIPLADMWVSASPKIMRCAGTVSFILPLFLTRIASPRLGRIVDKKQAIRRLSVPSVCMCFRRVSGRRY